MACSMLHKASPSCMCGVHTLCKHTYCTMSCYTCNMQVLCTHLLHEASKGATSFWQHYIAHLPTDYTLMMAFRQRHVEALQVPYARSTAQAAADRAFGDWTAAQPMLQGLGKSPTTSCLLAAKHTNHVQGFPWSLVSQQAMQLQGSLQAWSMVPLCIPLSTRQVLVPVSDMCVGS